MVDAIQAGQGPAELLSKVLTKMLIPLYFYFFLWPSLHKTFFSGPDNDQLHANDTNSTEHVHDDLPPPEYHPFKAWGMFLLNIFMTFSAFFAFILLMIYLKQESLLYVPSAPIQFIDQNPPRYKSPDERQMRYDEVWLRTADGIKIQGWFIHHGESAQQKRTVMFLHENAGNIGLRMDFFEILYKQCDCNILAVAYRGYSASEGTPNQEGIMLDAQQMILYLRSNTMINLNRVFLDGRSLGGAVALHLCRILDDESSKHGKAPFFKGAVIENTFTSICDMAD